MNKIPRSRKKVKKEDADMDLGANIKKARKQAGLTQAELAKRMEIQQRDISRWESNDRSPSVASFGKLCKAMGASADELLELI